MSLPSIQVHHVHRAGAGRHQQRSILQERHRAGIAPGGQIKGVNDPPVLHCPAGIGDRLHVVVGLFLRLRIIDDDGVIAGCSRFSLLGLLRWAGVSLQPAASSSAAPVARIEAGHRGGPCRR